MEKYGVHWYGEVWSPIKSIRNQPAQGAAATIHSPARPGDGVPPPVLDVRGGRGGNGRPVAGDVGPDDDVAAEGTAMATLR